VKDSCTVTNGYKEHTCLILSTGVLESRQKRHRHQHASSQLISHVQREACCYRQEMAASSTVDQNVVYILEIVRLYMLFTAHHNCSTGQIL